MRPLTPRRQEPPLRAPGAVRAEPPLRVPQQPRPAAAALPDVGPERLPWSGPGRVVPVADVPGNPLPAAAAFVPEPFAATVPGLPDLEPGEVQDHVLVLAELPHYPAPHLDHDRDQDGADLVLASDPALSFVAPRRLAHATHSARPESPAPRMTRPRGRPQPPSEATRALEAVGMRLRALGQDVVAMRQARQARRRAAAMDKATPQDAAAGPDPAGPADAPFEAAHAQFAASAAAPAAAAPHVSKLRRRFWPGRRKAERNRDPAPSRLSYRMHRLWLTPLYRAFLRVGLPAFALAFGIGIYLSDEGRRDGLVAGGERLVRSIQERPEFMVNLMSIEGASAELGEAIRTVLPVHFPVSSFDLDLEAMRLAVSELHAVASVDLRVRPGGILAVQVVERTPAVVWRGPDGVLTLDAGGHRVTRLASRMERPDLPVVAGEGADRMVPEALALIEAAGPVAARLRGLVRMGARRWDVVLDNGQRILLPEEGAVAALERVMALAAAEDMLGRDVTVIDMRYGARPTLRLTQDALNEMRRARPSLTGASSG